MISRRSVGFCSNTNCEDYLKGVFLLNHGNTFYCGHCGARGWIQEEIETDDAQPGEAFKTARVHFNFNATTRRYMDIAIVDIPELPVGAVYNLYTPLVKTEKRALGIAEARLCALNSGLKSDGSGITSHAMIIDYCSPDFPEQLAKLEDVLNERERRVAGAIERYQEKQLVQSKHSAG